MAHNFRVECVANLTVAVLDASVGICLRAYEDELATGSMVGGDKTLKDLLFRAMIRAGHLAGKFYVATETSTDKIVAFAVWFPPGQGLWETEEQRALGFNELMSKISPQTKDWWENTYRPRCHRFVLDIMGPKGVEDLWYLNLLGTDPPYQRRGIATMLLETVFKETAGIGSLLALCAANEPNPHFTKNVDFLGGGASCYLRFLANILSSALLARRISVFLKSSLISKSFFRLVTTNLEAMYM